MGQILITRLNAETSLTAPAQLQISRIYMDEIFITTSTPKSHKDGIYVENNLDNKKSLVGAVSLR